MRTTLTLDDDLAALLEQEAHRLRRPFKAVVNDAIRRGLGPMPTVPSAKYVVEPHQAALVAGIDPGALNRLADELETEAYAESSNAK